MAPPLHAPALDGEQHETLLVRRGPRSGAHVIIAVHSTALGPALGGCRMWPYSTLGEAVADALRLSRAMTLKAAAADLALGGGKSVLRLPAGAEPPRGAQRRRVLRDFAEALELLDGSYITAEDVGTSAADMALLARWSEHVVGRPAPLGGSGDPGAFTAAGVHAAMHACMEHVFGSSALRGRRVAIVGAGSVGGALARRLREEGTELVIADIDPAKQALARELDAEWMEPARALRADVDVLSPCALGGAIDAPVVSELRCRVICGAANNQLQGDELAAALAARGVLYAPDFIVNAAGLINVSLELTGYDAAQARRRAEGIEPLLGSVLAAAAASGKTPLRVAEQLAHERLRAARPGGPGRAMRAGASLTARLRPRRPRRRAERDRAAAPERERSPIGSARSHAR